jgi:hypothetical protein
MTNLGTGSTAFLDYVQTGKIVTGYARIILGTGFTTPSGTMYIDLPVAGSARRANMPCGTFHIQRGSAHYTGLAVVNTVGSRTVAALFSSSGQITATLLTGLASGDAFNLYFNYEAA